MYACPSHPSVQQSQTGTCPICNRALVLISFKKTKAAKLHYYAPLLVPFGLTILTAFVTSFEAGLFISEYFFKHLLAGTLLVGGGIKLLDTPRYIKDYQHYDVLSNVAPQYAMVRASLDILLAIAWLTLPNGRLLSIITLFVVGLGLAGIVKAFSLQRNSGSTLNTLFHIPYYQFWLAEDLIVALCSLLFL